MRLELENETEIIRYLNNVKEIDYKHKQLEHLVKTIIPVLPKKTQKKIQALLEEE